MQRLILMRHAKSAYPPGVPDHDRPLSERGRRDARTIAPRLRRFLRPDTPTRVLVSTAARTQQTWALVSADLDPDAPIDGLMYRRDEPALYLAEPVAILEAARRLDTQIGIVVGHNPGLEDLARSCRGSAEVVDDETSSRMIDKFPTSAFAVLDCPSGSWLSEDITCVAFAVCR